MPAAIAATLRHAADAAAERCHSARCLRLMRYF